MPFGFLILPVLTKDVAKLLLSISTRTQFGFFRSSLEEILVDTVITLDEFLK